MLMFDSDEPRDRYSGKAFSNNNLEILSGSNSQQMQSDGKFTTC